MIGKQTCIYFGLITPQVLLHRRAFALCSSFPPSSTGEQRSLASVNPTSGNHPQQSHVQYEYLDLIFLSGADAVISLLDSKERQSHVYVT